MNVVDVPAYVGYYFRQYKRGFLEMLNKNRIQIGDVYEDCAYRPILCVWSNPFSDELEGYSLHDGNKYSCSYWHCGPRLLTPAEVADLIRTDNKKES